MIALFLANNSKPFVIPLFAGIVISAALNITGAVPYTSYNIPGVVDEKQGETEVNQEATAVEDIDQIGSDVLDSDFDTTETITLDDGGTQQVIKPAGPLTELQKAKIANTFIGNEETRENLKRLQKYEGNKGKGRVFEGDEEMIGDPREYKTAKEIEEIGTGTGTGEGEGEETTELSAKDAIAENMAR